MLFSWSVDTPGVRTANHEKDVTVVEVVGIVG